MVPDNPRLMPLNVGDYLRDTGHLTAEQHGIYFLLLMAMWAQGGVLPNKPQTLSRIAKLTPRRWAKQAPVILPYFHGDSSWLVQKRLANELRKSRGFIESARQSGKAGNDAKALGRQQFAFEGLGGGAVKPSRNRIESKKESLADSQSAMRARARGGPQPLSAELRAIIRGMHLEEGES